MAGKVGPRLAASLPKRRAGMEDPVRSKAWEGIWMVLWL